MQIDSETFDRELAGPATWEEQTFRYCTFQNFEVDGPHITANFIDCIFDHCDMYWALFNVATLVGVTFRDCQFRGCAFSGCRFVECTFENCQFTTDNFNKPCRFEGTRWYNCKQSGTSGLDREWAKVESLG